MSDNKPEWPDIIGSGGSSEGEKRRHSTRPNNSKPTGRVRLEPAMTQREKEEAMRLIEHFKKLGLITVKPPLTDGQILALEGR